MKNFGQTGLFSLAAMGLHPPLWISITQQREPGQIGLTIPTGIVVDRKGYRCATTIGAIMRCEKHTLVGLCDCVYVHLTGTHVSFGNRWIWNVDHPTLDGSSYLPGTQQLEMFSISSSLNQCARYSLHSSQMKCRLSCDFYFQWVMVTLHEAVACVIDLVFSNTNAMKPKQCTISPRTPNNASQLPTIPKFRFSCCHSTEPVLHRATQVLIHD